MNPPNRRTVLLSLGLGAAAALAPAGGAFAAPAKNTGTSTATFPRTTKLRFGVATPGGPLAGAELDQVAAVAGERPSIILSYADFTREAPITELDAVTARGAVPLLTWEPWVAGAGTIQPAYALARIAAGDFDAYLRRWGAALAGWGKPVMLRFAHEMNGDWYPWSEAVNGNKRGDYVRAWKHVHDVVVKAGARNVRWVWSPNAGGPVPLAGLYPGRAYVDSLGLDGYNWGTTQSWSSWQAPGAVLGPWLDSLRSIAPGKEITIAETASTETGGSKADWITALVPYLSGQASVTGFVWFDMNKELDWRIDSSAASASAFATALAIRT